MVRKSRETVTPEETGNDNVFWRRMERQNVVWPTYPCGEVYIGSANNETNEILARTVPTSASTLNWSGYYGYQRGI